MNSAIQYAVGAVGVALCDAVEWMRRLEALTEYAPDMRAVELQPELCEGPDAFLNRPASEVRRVLAQRFPRLAFVSVHSPSSHADLGALWEQTRRGSVELVAAALRWAAELGAEVLVLHGGSFDWVDLDEREARRQAFVRSFAELAAVWHGLGHRRPQILIENLEYPKWAASAPEMWALKHECERFAPVAFCLDIPHLWHSRRILHEPQNHLHRARYLPPHLDRPSFGAYLWSTVQAVRSHTVLVHMAGCGFHQTHDPIWWPENNHVPEPHEPGEGHEAMLDLRPALRLVDQRAALRVPWILEVYNADPRGVRESLDRVRTFRHAIA